MAGRIVLFGATGYTGGLVAEALVARGAEPLLAGRDATRLAALAERLGGGLETAVADVDRPETVRALVERGDVLISTVGPFARWGEPAVRAAIDAGAHYLDSTGEAAFIRAIFERHGAAAAAAGCGLVTAFGYDFVPGNLAGALALRDAGDAAVRVDVGYYFTGSMRGVASGGTRASLIGATFARAHTWRDGRLEEEDAGRRVRSFIVGGRRRPAFSIGATEQFALPVDHPALRDVDVYLGWAGPLTRVVQGASLASAPLMRIPRVRAALAGAGERFAHGSTGGPDAATRATSGSHIVAVASSASGAPLAEVHVGDANGYDFTGAILAWGAQHALEHGLGGTGALGPAAAFGLDALEAGCAAAGLARV